MKKRAVVTGGCGFIGSYVVKELIREGYTVVVIDNLSVGKRVNVPDSVEIIEADICDEKTVLSVIEEGDIVFHLAALTSVPGSIENPLAYSYVNIFGTNVVLDVARKKKALGVIFSSSAAVYGNSEGLVDEDMSPSPVTPYAIQKHIGEKLCEQYTDLYKLPTVRLRYFNVYGKGNNETGAYAPVTARFLKAKRESSPLPIVGDGSQTRDFVHVEDVAKANVESIKLLSENNSMTINVCTGEEVSILDIAKMVGGEIEYLPPRIEIARSVGSATRLREKLGIEPRKLAEGFKDLLEIA